jgi:hypothetical protein
VGSISTNILISAFSILVRGGVSEKMKIEFQSFVQTFPSKMKSELNRGVKFFFRFSLKTDLSKLRKAYSTWKRAYTCNVQAA